MVRVDSGGILSISAKPGRLVRKNAEIATNTNPFGVEIELVRAPFRGIIIGVATSPTATQRKGICHIFKLNEPLKDVRARLMTHYGKKRIVF